MRFLWRTLFRPRLFGPRFCAFKYRTGPLRWGISRRGWFYRPNSYGSRGFSVGKPIFILLTVFVFSLFMYSIFQVEDSLKPTILTIAKAKSKQIAIEEINRVVKEKIAGNVEYEDIVKVHKDSSNKIVLLQPNTFKINKLQAETALEVNNALKNLDKQKAAIPLGHVTGSYLLATYGPSVPVRMSPIGTIDVKRVDEFEAAGINQTRHLLSFIVTTKVKMFLPLIEEEFEVTTEILIADNILVGEVPNTYLNLDLLNSMKNKGIKD